MREIIYGPMLATDNDIYLFREGTHRRIYTFLGAHIIEHEAKAGRSSPSGRHARAACR